MTFKRYNYVTSININNAVVVYEPTLTLTLPDDSVQNFKLISVIRHHGAEVHYICYSLHDSWLLCNDSSISLAPSNTIVGDATEYVLLYMRI